MMVLAKFKAMLKGNPSAKEKEEKERKAAIRRQRRIEKFEANQVWNIVYGIEKPKKKEEIKHIKNITFRNIWMEENYLYNLIVAERPDEVFHSPDKYTLQWEPPGSLYRVMIPLNNPQAQESAMHILQKLKKSKRKKVLFYFAPLNPEIGLFAPRVHPASKVSYADRPSVLRKLCDIYAEGKLTIEELNQLLESNYETWKIALYNLLPEDEQEYHRYLAKEQPKIVKKTIERQYLDDEISLQKYNDLKFPERKKRRDEEAATYPLPYDTGTCIICQSENAIIKCSHCCNLVCTNCIHSVFLNNDTSEGAFLLLHRRYCTKFGRLPDIHLTVMPEPAYLRELRVTGRGNMMVNKMFNTEIDEDTAPDTQAITIVTGGTMDEADKSEDEDGDDNIEDLFGPPDKSKEITPEMLHFEKAMKNALKRIEAFHEQIVTFQKVIDNPRRSEPLRERTARLKNELIEKYNVVNAKVEKITRKMKESENKTFFVAILEQADAMVQKFERLICAASLQEYENREAELLQMEKDRKNANLMLQFAIKK